MKKNIKKKKGTNFKLSIQRIQLNAFTTLELLIVIALVIVIGLTSVPFLSRFFIQNATADTYARLIGELRKAQTYAMMGKQNGPWGVYYNTSGGSKKIILYQGSSYASHINTAFDESYTVNPNVTVTGLNDINFAQVTGTTGANTTITISGSSNTTKTIQLNSQGIVNFAAAGPTNTPTPTGTGPPNWYNPNWLYRQAITINHTQVSGTQANFPVLINLASNGNLASNAQASGNDILFTDSSGTTKISHEIEQYTSATGALIAWVNVPSLSSTTDTKIYLYYGNPSATNQQNVTGTWNSNYLAIYHMNQTSGNIHDSTSNGNTGTTGGGPTSNSIGKIGKAESFSGSGTNNYYVLPDSVSLHSFTNSSYTISAWANPSGNPPSDNGNDNQDYFIAGKQGCHTGPTLGNGLYWYAQTFDSTCNTWYGAIAPTASSIGTWYFVQQVVDTAADTMSIYVNGILQATTGITPPLLNYGTTPTSIGEAAVGDTCSDTSGYPFCFYGSLDEVDISKVALSSSWIQTEYNNESAPSTFYSLAAQEVY